MEYEAWIAGRVYEEDEAKKIDKNQGWQAFKGPNQEELSKRFLRVFKNQNDNFLDLIDTKYEKNVIYQQMMRD